MADKLKQPVTVALLAALACLLWGSTFPGVKIGYEWFHIEDTGSQLLFAGYRFAMAGVFTYAAGCMMSKQILGVKKEALPGIFLLGIVQTGIQYFFFYVGLAHTTGVKGSIINALNAFAAIILAHFFLKGEKMTREKWIGSALGFAGVVIVNYSAGGLAGGISLYGEGFLIFASINYGVASLITKKIARNTNAMIITAGHLFIGGLLLIAAGKLMHGRVEGFTVKASLLLLYLAVLSAVAFSIWTLLIKYNRVGKISVYTFLTPVFGVVLSGLFLGEKAFTLKNLGALILVSIGVYIVNREKSGDKNRKSVS